MTLHVVLVHPDIPQNTGNIARLTAATYTPLHLIEPLGFEISDRQLKRAGLDYWPEVQLHQHKNWEAFLETTGCSEGKLWIFTTHATRCYTQARFQDEDFLVFGSETRGLPNNFHQRYEKRRLLIPMDNPRVRSLNLSSAAALVLYEARRQLSELNS